MEKLTFNIKEKTKKALKLMEEFEATTETRELSSEMEAKLLAHNDETTTLLCACVAENIDSLMGKDGTNANDVYLQKLFAIVMAMTTNALIGAELDFKVQEGKGE